MAEALAVSGGEPANLSAAQKAAVLLMLVGEEEASAMIGDLGPAEVEALGRAMLEMSDVDRATSMHVIEEFIAHAETGIAVSGGLDFFRGALSKAMGDVRATSVLQRVTPFQDRYRLPGSEWLSADALRQMMVCQHPQAAAASLTLISPALAADVILGMEEERQVDILYRLAILRELKEEAVALLVRHLAPEGGEGLALPVSSIPGNAMTVAILKSMPDEQNRPLLAALRKRDDIVGSEIEENMLRFEDLMEMPPRSLQLLIQAIDLDTLARALRGAPEALAEKIYAGMSTRAAQTVQDALKGRGGKASDIAEARTAIVKSARTMAEKGEIELVEEKADV